MVHCLGHYSVEVATVSEKLYLTTGVLTALQGPPVWVALHGWIKQGEGGGGGGVRVPALTRRALARCTSSGSQLWASPTRMAVERAMQRWPAAPKAAPTSWFSVFSLLASGITTPWFFAPWKHAKQP